ncbi:MAG: hypothetical protein AB1726_11985 [Planctomycetota bacterium]
MVLSLLPSRGVAGMPSRQDREEPEEAVWHELMVEGEYIIEGRESFWMPPAEARRRSEAYMRDLSHALFGSSDPYLRRQAPLTEQFLSKREFRALVLSKVRKQEQWEGSEVLLIRWPDWSLRKTVRSPETGNTTCTITTHGPQGRTGAQYFNGNLVSQHRAHVDGPADNAEGYLWQYLELRRILGKLSPPILQEMDQGTIPDSVVEQDLRGRMLYELLQDMLLPTGLSGYPGRVVIRGEGKTRPSLLTLLWYDSEGGLVHRDTMSWRSQVPLPDLKREDLLPGTDFVAYAVEDDVLQIRETVADDSFTWEPVPGFPITDDRFGGPIQYHASATGALPDDVELRAHLEGALVDHELVPEVAMRVPVEEGAPEAAAPAPPGEDSPAAAEDGARPAPRPDALEVALRWRVLSPLAVGAAASMVLVLRRKGLLRGRRNP